MELMNVSGILIENSTIRSEFLDRDVTIDFLLPKNVADPSQISLLLINDGQNMEELGLGEILQQLYRRSEIRPLFCAAIHAGEERKAEYGVASTADYRGRGARAAKYRSFIMKELMPYIQETYKIQRFYDRAFAGFSLGGLTALDTVWDHPEEFSMAGIFSGSLWWRSVGLANRGYSDERHRIMHQRIINSAYKPGLRFFFQTGTQDEKMDRNNNGIIDSIDDTLDLIRELKEKGYSDKDVFYLEIEKGRHDIATWKIAMPAFLKWGWGVKSL